MDGNAQLNSAMNYKHYINAVFAAFFISHAEAGKAKTPPATGPWLLIKHTDSSES